MSDNSSFVSLNGASSNSTSCWNGITVISVTKAIFLVPLYVLVLYLALRRWMQQRSFKTATHSDIFTYHVAAFMTIWLLVRSFQVVGVPVRTPFSDVALDYVLSTSWFGEGFHVLTCVERHLAVVHPILCSLSVLYVLNRPGPGDGGRDRERSDQAKKRAFHTITVRTVVLWLWYGGILTTFFLDLTPYVDDDIKCLVTLASYALNLLSSLVLPLLYLHRAGKLAFSFP